MKKSKVPKTLIEVWRCKEEAYKEVENLPIETAIERRIDDSIRMTKKLKFIMVKLVKTERH